MPGREGWLAQLGSLFRTETLGGVIDTLGYRNPAELLTMHLCLYMARPRKPWFL
jgi:hypothetical protein